MLNRLFPRRKAQPKPLPQPNAQLALGALLVRVAFADRNYRASEIGQIDQILARTFGLKPIEAAKLRATCEALERDAPGTPEFTRILREEVDYADRKALGEAMWQVALSDGARAMMTRKSSLSPSKPRLAYRMRIWPQPAPTP